MTQSVAWLDCIYVTASRSDARATRICVASIRHFYPRVPIKLLVGGPLEEGLENELAQYWDVGVSDVPRRDWGWGFVKLEPLFGRPGERFLVLDSDTAFVGPVLDAWSRSSADFLVDDEIQSEADTKRLYYDWRAVASFDRSTEPPAFVFNSGQWFGTAGIITRDDFSGLVDWSSFPPRLCRPDLFMPGDQGVLNLVFNRKAAAGQLTVDRRPIMRWPGHGVDGISVEALKLATSPPVVVHWAGYKRSRLGALPAADLLRFFESRYYAALPAGSLLRMTRAAQSFRRHLQARISTRSRWLLQKALRRSRNSTYGNGEPDRLHGTAP